MLIKSTPGVNFINVLTDNLTVFYAFGLHKLKSFEFNVDKIDPSIIHAYFFLYGSLCAAFFYLRFSFVIF